MAKTHKVKVKKVGQWDKLRKVLPQVDEDYKKAQTQAVEKEALLFAKKVDEAFKTSGGSNGKKWAPNSRSTIAIKGSAKPLINSGDLRSSITVKNVGADKFFAGVPNNVRSKNGGQMVNIGEVHEFGKVIVMRITKKQHAFVMANLAKLGGGRRGGGGSFRVGGTLVIKIPQRSFLGATMEAHFTERKSRSRIKRRISAKLRAKYGNLALQ